MVINIYKLIGIFGLILIITGTILLAKKNKNKRKIFPMLLIGGIFLEIYSIWIKDTIFIILQGVYILATIYGIIKTK